MSASRDDLRRWVDQHRLAAERELREEQDRPAAPALALERGLALIAFARRIKQSPASDDPKSEDLAAYARWARVRTALRTP